MFQANEDLIIRTKAFLDEMTRIFPHLIIYLVGSYALETQTLGSDIDILIIVNHTLKQKVIQTGEKILKADYSDLLQKLDCKILSTKEVNNPENHLFLASCLKNGKQQTEKGLHFKLSPEMLRSTIYQFEERQQKLKADISDKQNYNIMVYQLISQARTLIFLGELLNLKHTPTHVKDIFGKKGFHKFIRIYEAMTPKGILDGLTITFRQKQQRSGNFQPLNIAFQSLEGSFNTILTEFNQWYYQHA